MGIVNLTPDSFSQDGCLKNLKTGKEKAVRLALKHLREGADIIDLGGESSRPGAEQISVREELGRILPVLKALMKKINRPISVDTYKPAVAQHALDAGVSIINNIKGVRAEKSLLKMIRNYHATVILMHMKGTPRTMQRKVHYHNLMEEVISSLRNSIEICLEIGIPSDRIIIDPGIGFGKTIEHNLEIINQLGKFNILNQPLLIGTSRKSFIGKILDRDVQHRLLGTMATACVSVLRGAHIVRVHDVQETYETVKIADAILNQQVEIE